MLGACVWAVALLPATYMMAFFSGFFCETAKIGKPFGNASVNSKRYKALTYQVSNCIAEAKYGLR